MNQNKPYSSYFWTFLRVFFLSSTFFICQLYEHISNTPTCPFHKRRKDNPQDAKDAVNIFSCQKNAVNLNCIYICYKCKLFAQNNITQELTSGFLIIDLIKKYCFLMRAKGKNFIECPHKFFFINKTKRILPELSNKKDQRE